MRNRSLSLCRHLTLSCFVATASTVSADEIFVASSNTAVARVAVEGGNFQVVSACGGVARASAFDGAALFLADDLGSIYRFDPTTSQTQFFSSVPNNGRALVVRADELLVAGTTSTSITRVHKTSGAVIGTISLSHSVSSMTIVGSKLFVGSELGTITTIDLAGGPTTLLGTCTGAIASMTADATHLIIGSGFGFIFRMNIETGILDDFFMIDSDCKALAIQGGSLLVAGSDGNVRRVNRVNGAAQGTLHWQFDISTLAVAHTDPGLSSGFGSACPCGNTDTLGGCKNSTAVGAYLGGSGSVSITADDLTLSVFNLPPNSFGRIFMGASTSSASFGDGLLCVNGSGSGLIRYPVQNSGAEGRFTFGPGLRAFAASHFGASTQIAAGGSWNFQAYYRDTAGPCGSGFNTTNALRVSFEP